MSGASHRAGTLEEGVTAASAPSVRPLPRIVRSFFRQFSRPTGLLGRLAGRIMARSNAAVNQWALELLEVAPEDRVLDVACGAGRHAIAAAPEPRHWAPEHRDRLAFLASDFEVGGAEDQSLAATAPETIGVIKVDGN